jgi:3-oxoacyl-[acyl-carrier-protein] synthase II
MAGNGDASGAVRVVITGMGIMSPVGLGREESWASLLGGVSGVAPIRGFDPERIEVKLAAEMKGFDPEAVVEKREARKMDRCSITAIAAAREAWAQSGLAVGDPEAVGVVIGSAFGGAATIQSGMQTMFERGPGRIGPHLHGAMLVDTPGFEVAHDLGVIGPNFSVTSACASGAHAVGVASDLVRHGEADVVLAGGVDTLITEYIMGGFGNMKVLGSPLEGRGPETASRPFDLTRDGFVLGEGATVMVLEREADARARGAEIVAEVVTWSATNDAFHIAAPREDCVGIERMFRTLLRKGDLAPTDIGYVNPHGTGTQANDRLETVTIRSVFGAAADGLAVSSTKSMTGHQMGAAGAFEVAVAALAVRDRVVPPTINLETPDPACDLDYVPEGRRELPALETAVSCSIGLGGHNGAVAVRRA